MEHTLPRRADDFAAWYRTVVERAELAEHGLVRGSMIIRPYGYAIWERLQAALDERIKATGHENVSFPLLIPHGVIDREAQLVTGFAPEVAVVTRRRRATDRAAGDPPHLRGGSLDGVRPLDPILA